MTDALLRVVAAIIARLPRTAIAPIGSALGWLAGSLLRIRRSLVEAAMRRAGVMDEASSARRMYRGLGRGLVELLWLAGAQPAKRDATLARSPIDDDLVCAIDEGLTRGPVILFASHTGNWELAAAAAARMLDARGRRLVVVAKRMHTRGVDAFVGRLRAAFGVRIIPPAGALASARRALASGDVIVMPIDQVPDRASHGTAISFLGALALVDRAPATLAWRARATVLVVAGQKLGDSHRFRLLGTVPPPDASKDLANEWIHATTTFASSRLEAFVKSAPDAWMWLHRRWRMPRERATRRTGARGSIGLRGLVATEKPG